MTTQINQLTELTTTSDGDLLLIRENATGVDKKIQAVNLRAKATTKDDVGLGNVPNLDTTNAVAGNFSSVNIDGGNIDGTPIGVSSASSGAFTTLTASDDVNFDSGTLFVDASANNVGIGTTSPAAPLNVRKDGAGSVELARFSNHGESEHYLILKVDDTANFVNFESTGASSGGFEFFAGNTPRMRIDSSGNVGIGTTSPQFQLQVINGGLDSRGAGAGIAIRNNMYFSSGDKYLTASGAASSQYFDGSGNIIFYNTGTASTGAGNAVTVTERMRIDSSGNVGIGTTVPAARLSVLSASGEDAFEISGYDVFKWDNTNQLWFGGYRGSQWQVLKFATAGAERMRIDSDGSVIFQDTLPTNTTNHFFKSGSHGYLFLGHNATGGTQANLFCNRNGADGDLIQFRQAGVTEGSISVSGTTVSYNGGHLSRWSQLPDNTKDENIVKGTVMTNLDEMAQWVHEDGTVEDNEQLNCMTVSDVEGDLNVAGVFVNWDDDDDMNIAMTGDMVIRIAQGVTVKRGDLLMSAGDGTAKPQGDDVVRSKTIAKVTSTHITCTYDDGSYCVPCVLMAC